MKNSIVVSFLSPFKVGQAGNLWTLPRSLMNKDRKIGREQLDSSEIDTETYFCLLLCDCDVLCTVHIKNYNR